MSPTTAKSKNAQNARLWTRPADVPVSMARRACLNPRQQEIQEDSAQKRSGSSHQIAIQTGLPPWPRAAFAPQQKESGWHDFRLTPLCSGRSGEEPAKQSQRLQKQRSL